MEAKMFRVSVQRPGDISYALLGVSPRLLAMCPWFDRFCITILWVPLAALGGWQALIFTLTLQEALAPESSLDPLLVLLACVISGLIMMGELFVFVRPSWLLKAHRLIQNNLDNAPAFDSAPAKWLIAARLMLLVGAATINGTLGAEQIYKAEIGRQLDANNLAANAKLGASAAARVDAPIEANRQALALQQKRLATAEDQLAGLRSAPGESATETPEIKRQVAEINRLLQEKATADAALRDAQQFASDELAGVAGPGLSGKAGSGPRRTAALERVANAEAAATAAASALRSAQDRLNALQAAASAAIDANKDGDQARLQELLKDRDAAQVEIEGLTREYQELLASREKSIATALANDPLAIPKERGLTARTSALWQIAWEHPADLPIIAAVHLLLIGIDLLALLSVSVITLATTYIRLLAFEEVSANDAMARELAKRLNIGRPPAPVIEGTAVLAVEPKKVEEIAPSVPPPTAPEPPPFAFHTPTMAMELYAKKLREESRKLEEEKEDASKPATNVLPFKRPRGRPAGSKNKPKPSTEPHNFSKSPPAKPPGENKTDDDKGPEGKDDK
jgi:hypothetical protein